MSRLPVVTGSDHETAGCFGISTEVSQPGETVPVPRNISNIHKVSLGLQLFVAVPEVGIPSLSSGLLLVVW